MADTKISNLTAATTPLDGTEVLPIVQGGATKKVANNNLRPKQIQSNATSGVLQIVGPSAAATRVMTTPDADFTAARTDATNSFTGDQTLSTGNIIPATAGKGINFAANSAAAGMTSQLLNWYEEGTWTPTDASGAGLTLTGASGKYTRVGRLVTVSGQWTFPSTVNTSNVAIGGLPFAAGANYTGSQLSNAPANDMTLIPSGTGSIYFYTTGFVRRTNANYSVLSFYFSASYTV